MLLQVRPSTHLWLGHAKQWVLHHPRVDSFDFVNPIQFLFSNSSKSKNTNNTHRIACPLQPSIRLLFSLCLPEQAERKLTRSHFVNQNCMNSLHGSRNRQNSPDNLRIFITHSGIGYGLSYRKIRSDSARSHQTIYITSMMLLPPLRTSSSRRCILMICAIFLLNALGRKPWKATFFCTDE